MASSRSRWHGLAQAGHSIPLACLLDSPFRRPDWYPAAVGASPPATTVSPDIVHNLLGEAALEGGSLDPGLRVHLSATARLLPGTFPGRLLCVCAASSPFYSDETRQGWASVAAGGLEVHAIEATHYGLIRPPSVDEVADVLEAKLTAREASSV